MQNQYIREVEYINETSFSIFELHKKKNKSSHLLFLKVVRFLERRNFADGPKKIECRETSSNESGQKKKLLQHAYGELIVHSRYPERNKYVELLLWITKNGCKYFGKLALPISMAFFLPLFATQNQAQTRVIFGVWRTWFEKEPILQYLKQKDYTKWQIAASNNTTLQSLWYVVFAIFTQTNDLLLLEEPSACKTATNYRIKMRCVVSLFRLFISRHFEVIYE